MIAYCGLTCDTCPIYLATMEQDEARQQSMRASIARLCTETYGMVLKPEDIGDCDGCRSNAGRLFSGCKDCGIRKCASQRSLENCASCPDYPCNALVEFFSHEPAAQQTLDTIRSGIGSYH